MFAFVLALFAFAAGAGFLVGGGDGVEAGAHDRAAGLGRAAHDGGGPADHGAGDAALEHQGSAHYDGGLTSGDETAATHR